MNILIIDDDKEIRDSLRDILEDEGFNVFMAENGEQGLEFLEENKPSLILLDLMMPIMDGKTFREMQLRNPAKASIPTVVFTASGKGEMSKIENVDGYLKKPIDLSELLQTIKKFAP